MEEEENNIWARQSNINNGHYCSFLGQILILIFINSPILTCLKLGNYHSSAQAYFSKTKGPLFELVTYLELERKGK